jgi:hypothetical protein
MSPHILNSSLLLRSIPFRLRLRPDIRHVHREMKRVHSRLFNVALKGLEFDPSEIPISKPALFSSI